VRTSIRWGIALVVTSAVVGAALALLPHDAEAPTELPPVDPPVSGAARPDPGLQPGPADKPDAVSSRPAFDRSRRSTTDPRSICGRQQGASDPAAGLPPRADAGAWLPGRATGRSCPRRADGGGRTASLGLKIASAYRSYGYQAGVYAATVATRGAEAADQVSARPGHSEHQTGLAVDLVVPGGRCNFAACFADTPPGRWVAANVWRYGFVLRYQPGTAAVTGYAPEPWHLRYVGQGLAAELRRTGIRTLERFFDLRGGDYR
jgi:D-alanyl-D-alanine carboxypeptidase